MKRKHLFLFLVVFMAMAQPVFATTYNGVVEILFATSGNPFGVSAGDEDEWTAVYDENDIGEYVNNAILLNADTTEPTSLLTIDIGNWTFNDDMDVDFTFDPSALGRTGMSALYFWAGSVLNGVDALTDYQYFRGSYFYEGKEYTHFAFTTNTPLPGGSPANFDFTTFSIFAATDVLGSDQLEIVNGKLMDPIPEPGTLVLFGVGLLGLCGVIRRKKK